MASQGPNGPGTLADDASVGTKTWASPSNAATSNDVRSSSNVGGGTGTATMHYLKATNFGFSIPSGATIDGVVVSIERQCSVGGSSRNSIDATVKLVKGGTVSGNNKADTGTQWPVVDTVATYGSSSDLWGLSLTDTDVNASTFGMVVNATVKYAKPTNTIPAVDYISMTVYYTAGGGGGSQTSAVAFAND